MKEVQQLRDKDPAGYKTHRKTKLLKRVQTAIEIDVPENPLHKKFLLGGSLSDRYKDWRRVKSGLPGRYRMFFRFSSAEKNIIFAWLNDEFTLRKEGDNNDVYAVFEGMLNSGDVPAEYEELRKQSKRPPMG
ncbi:MAG: type II toxin-antitoxin system YhaV family toxin [Desulfobacterales bacterium]|nr:type II toxin-antitoxin system YhaV family toxin [Desulfobacterales bacterium]